jgi:Ca2+/Na+ antiporter
MEHKAMGMRNFWRSVVWVGFLVLLAGVCRGDGKFVPARSFSQMPTMPQQRALIVFDGKHETLMVESVMQADAGTRFAWLLPLPSKPDAIRPADVGLLNTLSFCCGPEIHNATHTPRFKTCVLILLTLLLTVAVATHSAAVRRTSEGVLALIAILAILSLQLRTQGVKGDSTSREGALALSNECVGNYQVAVLAARHATEIEAWLTAHQFAGLPVESRAIVEDYLTQGWVIVAAELQRSGTGRLAPHPLSVTFPATQPIYPMRLTAMGRNSLKLSLFVAALDRYEQPDLETVYAQTSGRKFHEFEPSALFARDEAFAALRKQWAWITHLRGEVTPEQMTRDFMLVPAVKQIEYRKVVYTPEAAFIEALFPVMRLLVVLLPLGALLARWRRWSRRKVLGGILTGAFIVLVYLWVEHPLEFGTRTIWGSRLMSHVYSLDIKEELEALHLSGGESAEKIESRVRGGVLNKRKNFFTDEPLREEASPGNYKFEQTSETLMLALYDETGEATRIVLRGLPGEQLTEME